MRRLGDDTKLSGEVDAIEGRDAIRRDLEKTRELGPCEPHEVQQGQVQGPVLGSGQTLLSIQATLWEQAF